MAEIKLNQVEADALIAVANKRDDDEEWLFPGPGDRIAVPLTSLDKRESFMLDLTRGEIKLTKATYQNRARQVIVLGDTWANPAPVERYANTRDLFSTLDIFMQDCNITDPPSFQRGLFS